MAMTVNMTALAAASQASVAATGLLRFCTEGPSYREPPFGDDEVVEKLADALKLSLEVQQAEAGNLDDERERLLGECVRYLEGWA